MLLTGKHRTSCGSDCGAIRAGNGQRECSFSHHSSHALSLPSARCSLAQRKVGWTSFARWAARELMLTTWGVGFFSLPGSSPPGDFSRQESPELFSGPSPGEKGCNLRNYAAQKRRTTWHLAKATDHRFSSR